MIRGAARRIGSIDFVTVEGLSLRGLEDDGVLDLALALGRVLLTHDLKTLVPLADARVVAGEPCPAVFWSHWDTPLGPAIESLVTIILASDPQEYAGFVTRLPL